VVIEPLQGGRRAIERHSELLPHDSDGCVDSSNPAKHIRHQVTAVEAFAVPAKRNFIVRSTIDVIKNRARQTPPGEFSKVMKVVTGAQAHFPPPISALLERLREIPLFRGFWRDFATDGSIIG
jgi:hypothetical protein